MILNNERDAHFCLKNRVNKNSYSIVELTDFKTRRIAHFRKNLVDLAELEIKHAKVWYS